MATEMRVRIRCGLEAFAAKENTRYAISGVAIVRRPSGKVVAVATDGRYAVIHPCETEGEWPIKIEDSEMGEVKAPIIPASMMKIATQMARGCGRSSVEFLVRPSGVYFRLDIAGTHPSDASRVRLLEGLFPPIGNVVLPTSADTEAGTCWASFDGTRLAALDDFLCDFDEGLRFGVDAFNKAVRVYGSHGMAVLMPMVINGEYPGDEWDEMVRLNADGLLC